MSELAPGFLVASPALVDPNFAGTVVLVVEHSEEGSLGFIMNRPAHLEFSDVVQQLELGADLLNVEVPVMIGGPVSRGTGWLVFESTEDEDEAEREGAIQVTSRLRVSASKQTLVEVAGRHLTGDGQRAMLVQGYAGWGAGQLEEELREGAWIPVGLDEKVIFGTPLEERWSQALRVLGIDPATLSANRIAQA